MRNEIRKIISLLLVAVMMLTTMPIGINAAEIVYEPATNGMTVQLRTENNEKILGATISAVGEYAYTTGGTQYALQFQEDGNGKYTVFRGRCGISSYNITITVTAPGYEETTVVVKGRTTSTTIKLKEAETGPAYEPLWEGFNMYYFLNGSPEHPFPPTYAGAGEAVNYGPSRDDMPFAVIYIDINKLRYEYPDVAIYQEGANGNIWHFIPSTSEPNLDDAKAFWTAVKECISEESLVLLESTGLADQFIGYALKKQNEGPCHLDGYLEVSDKVYSIELYKDDRESQGTYTYVGGLLTNKGQGYDEDFKTLDDVLAALEGYLGQVITWEEDENGNPISVDGVYTGTYVHEGHLHTLTVYQSNIAQATVQPEGSEIAYEPRNDNYYMATFILKTEEAHDTEHIITYTDGDAAGTAFYPHTYEVIRTSASEILYVPAFTGYAAREGYTFLGWILEGGDGRILTDSQVQALTVTEDMVFHAEWLPLPPTYIGSIHVILNGTYDAVNNTITSGTYIDIHAVTGELVQLYVKEENSDSYIRLTDREGAVGIYEAVLENGNYTIHYSVDGGNTIKPTDSQFLTIDNADRHRYLFFNSVEYDLNGGDASDVFASAYYQAGAKHIHIVDQIPTRDRYIFSHWTDQYGNVYMPGDLLTDEISKPYILTAQWKDAVDVYVNIQIFHQSEDGSGKNNDNGMHDIFFTIDQRSGVGDYTEIYTKNIVWDGVSAFEDPVYDVITVFGGIEQTHYESYVPVLKNVPADSQYTFTTNKSGYALKTVQQEFTENGDILIEAVLVFDPNDFDFVYEVSLDEEAKQLPEIFKPVAVNVKVISWYDSPNDEDYGLQPGDETVDWYTVTQQRYTYERVVLDENGEGTGSLPVWKNTTDADTVMNYHYRIEVVSFEMPNGEINPATNVNGGNEKYLSDCEHVEANVVVTGGECPDPANTSLNGAFYQDGAQVGHVEAIVSIHTYSVTFDPNGGVLNGSELETVVEPLFQIPHLDEYSPTRTDGYVFEGWYFADSNGEITDVQAESYMPLHEDVRLIAKWKEPKSITANITLDTAYLQENADGTTTLHFIHAKERVDHATVVMQRILANGYPETISVHTVPLTYDGQYGVGSITFDQIPDDGHEYRIRVIVHDYTFIYQNEPDSLDASKNTDFAGSYNQTDYTAEYGDDREAVINAYGWHTPKEYDLQYIVDATAIGEGFRPDGAQILITHDDDKGITDPSLWPVISQMEFGDTLVGQFTPMSGGYGSGSYPAWCTYPNGVIAEYALRLQSTQINGVTTAYEDTAPFSVSYRVPAYFVEPDGQSQLLQAILTPNTYPVYYELDGGELVGQYPTEHTWSYATDISGVTAVKSGYIFEGWYLDENRTQPAGDVIDASIYGEVTLYAKWRLAMDRVNVTVTIDHMQGNDPLSSSGQAAAYNRILYIQLTNHEDGGEGVTYMPVDGTVKSYNSDYWHTMEDGSAEEVFSVYNIYYDLPSDMAYNAIVSMEGYILVEEKCKVTPMSDEDSENGTVYDVELYLEYHPELLNIDFTVRMDENVDPALDPVAAQVKVTSWYDQPYKDLPLGWHVITQHQENYVTVALDEQTRSGSGSYQVWQWYLQDQGIPFYYRIEVVGLVLKDGTVVPMLEQEAEVSYTGSIYTATVYAENGAEVPIPQDELHNTTLTGVLGVDTGDGLKQKGTLEAVITVSEPWKIVFHANNTETLEGSDIYRTYYPAGAVLPDSNSYSLNGYGQVGLFYDIPTFEYETHNSYIFKGWYMGTEEDAEPMDWNAVYSETTHVYAHWIEVGEVERENDGKIFISDLYSEFDLLGNQIRTSEINPGAHYGDAGAGLRFISSLSERIYQELNGLHFLNNEGIEYGFVLAKTNAADAKATGEDYRLKYKHGTINGEDTTSDYSYAINTPCRVPNKAVDDHFAGVGYRLYTAVITYKNLTGDALVNAQNTNFIARSYLRYFDANGLERIHYNNYTGNSATYGGINTCYATVYEMVMGQ